jgi:glycosyltransferase involved in cell wall biosynthesis
MSDVLIVATAGLREDQLADTEHKMYPRVDYLELAQRVDATIINYSFYEMSMIGPYLCRVETFLRSDVSLALVSLLRSRRHKVVFTMSERAGIPLAGFRKVIPLRRPFVFMFTAWSESQRKVTRGLNLLSEPDKIVTKNSTHAALLCDELGVPSDKIEIVPFAIDQRFFHPMSIGKAFDVLSVGEVRGRDYKTLIESVAPLDVSVHIAASGSWYARQKQPNLGLGVPPNVSVGGGYLPFELRERYAQSRLVVIPTRRGVGAGTTVALEAMAMGIPVIANKDGVAAQYVLDGETGVLVEPEDPIALREAMMFLLNDPREAQRLGENARHRVEQEFGLDVYVDRLAEIISETLLAY